MISKYSCRSCIRRNFGKIKCSEITPNFPENRSTQTCTDRATLIEHFFLTGEYLRSMGVAEYQFPDGVDDHSEIDITRLQNIQAPELSQLSRELKETLDKKTAHAVESIIASTKKTDKTVVNTEGVEHHE